LESNFFTHSEQYVILPSPELLGMMNSCESDPPISPVSASAKYIYTL